MPIGAHRDLTECRRFFLEPRQEAAHVQVFALSRRGGPRGSSRVRYTPAPFGCCATVRRRLTRLLRHADAPPRGCASQDARAVIRAKHNYSIYESKFLETLKERSSPLTHRESARSASGRKSPLSARLTRNADASAFRGGRRQLHSFCSAPRTSSPGAVGCSSAAPDWCERPLPARRRRDLGLKISLPLCPKRLLSLNLVPRAQDHVMALVSMRDSRSFAASTSSQEATCPSTSRRIPDVHSDYFLLANISSTTSSFP